MFANAKSSEFRLKCVSRNPELGGCARRTRNAPMGLRQRGFDHFHFTLCQCRKAIPPVPWLCWWAIEPAFINRERVPFAQNDTSLHHVLQFANVSGPSVAFEYGERLLVYVVDVLASFLGVTTNEVFEQ